MAFKTNESSVKDLMDILLKQWGITEKFKENQATAAWEKVMGAFIASKTTEVSISNRKLYVKMLSPALRNELQYDKEKIRNLMNKEIGDNFISEVILG